MPLVVERQLCGPVAALTTDRLWPVTDLWFPIIVRPVERSSSMVAVRPQGDVRDCPLWGRLATDGYYLHFAEGFRRRCGFRRRRSHRSPAAPTPRLFQRLGVVPLRELLEAPVSAQHPIDRVVGEVVAADRIDRTEPFQQLQHGRGLAEREIPLQQVARDIRTGLMAAQVVDRGERQHAWRTEHHNTLGSSTRSGYCRSEARFAGAVRVNRCSKPVDTAHERPQCCVCYRTTGKGRCANTAAACGCSSRNAVSVAGLPRIRGSEFHLKSSVSN